MQVRPLDERHRDVLDAVGLTQIVNAEDVLVRDLPREQQLLLEAPLEVDADAGIRQHLGPDHLERDRDAELLVLRLVDRAHAADAQQPLDAVATGKQHPGA